MKNEINLSIILPVYNEEKIIEMTISRIIGDIQKQFRQTFEIILVENGSTDNSAKIADRLASNYAFLKVIHLPQANYGEALRSGYLSASGKFMGNFSMDWVDMNFLIQAIKKINTYDIILASKNSEQSKDDRSTVRKWGGRLFHLLVRTLFGMPITDTHGLKLLRRDKTIDIVKICKFRHEIFDTEMIVRAYRLGLKVVELPIYIKENRSTRVNVWKRALNGLMQILNLRIVLWKESVMKT